MEAVELHAGMKLIRQRLYDLLPHKGLGPMSGNGSRMTTVARSARKTPPAQNGQWGMRLRGISASIDSIYRVGCQSFVIRTIF